ncbi:MAG: hypothetical protein AVO33_00935 [delta proteobacterium ML8_F1]|nr:MAG: hypothetical protein AVO33_00935 [delta proteobacterium ML8_F1]
MDKKVSNIIVHFRTFEMTLNTVRKIMQWTSGIEYEIILVDNHSEDGSIVRLEGELAVYIKRQLVRVLCISQNRGFPPSRIKCSD